LLYRNPRAAIYLAYCLAFFSVWTPRLPFLRSKRFWIWTASSFSVSFLSLLIVLWGPGLTRVDIPELIIVSLIISVPCQSIGMMVHWWLDQKRGERRGFDVVQADEETG